MFEALQGPLYEAQKYLWPDAFPATIIEFYWI